MSGRYLLHAPVGAGGCGVVWSAEHLQRGERVAVKIVGDQADELLTLRLQREAELLQSVRHVGLVRVHEIVECDSSGAPGLVMELLRGEDLARRIARTGRFDTPRLATLLLPAIDALAALHQRAIAHRDVKPSNLFLEVDGRGVEFAKVLDLGLARCLDAGADGAIPRLTESGMSIGTPHYMAPEQLVGARDVDCLADVWAIGIVLIEALSGGTWTIPVAHLRGQGDHVERRVKDLPTDVPKNICELIVSCLSVSRQRRPTMREIRDAFAAIAVVPQLSAGVFKSS